MKAPILYRISSVLLLLFAAGHTFGFRQNNSEWGADAVLGIMRSVHFNAGGFNRSYWDFFSAFGLYFSVFLLFAAVLAWQLGGLPAETLAGVRSIAWALAICFVAVTALSWEVRLHPPHRFLNRDYSVFDCGGVALGEDGLNLDWESDRSDPGRRPGSTIRQGVGSRDHA